MIEIRKKPRSLESLRELTEGQNPCYFTANGQFVRGPSWVILAQNLIFEMQVNSLQKAQRSFSYVDVICTPLSTPCEDLGKLPENSPLELRLANRMCVHPHHLEEWKKGHVSGLKESLKIRSVRPDSSLDSTTILRGFQSASRTVLICSPFWCGLKMGVTGLYNRREELIDISNKWDMREEIRSSHIIDRWIASIDEKAQNDPLVMREPFARAEKDEQGNILGGFILRDTSLLQKNIWVPGFSVEILLPGQSYLTALAKLQANLLYRYGLWNANLHEQNVRVQISDEGELTERAIAIDLSDFGIIEPIASRIAKTHRISLPTSQVFPTIVPYRHSSSESAEKYLQDFAKELERLWKCPGKISPIFDSANCEVKSDDAEKLSRLLKLWGTGTRGLPDLDYERVAWLRFGDWLESFEGKSILEIVSDYTEIT